jgi:hypothetical protein
MGPIALLSLVCVDLVICIDFWKLGWKLEVWGGRGAKKKKKEGYHGLEPDGTSERFDRRNWKPASYPYLLSNTREY